MRYKQPRSVQVVIFRDDAGDREYLLLRRVTADGGFWQAVTGSLEPGESHAEAAVREVREETGIQAAQSDLIDLEIVNTFEIAPEWRPKYAPGVTRNEEVCFALQVSNRAIEIDPLEHDTYLWVRFDRAIGTVCWTSSRLALAAAASVDVHVREVRNR